MSYFNYELSAKLHDNSNQLPHNAYTTEELKHTVTFIKNCAETHGIYYYQGEFLVIKGWIYNYFPLI